MPGFRARAVGGAAKMMAAGKHLFATTSGRRRGNFTPSTRLGTTGAPTPMLVKVLRKGRVGAQMVAAGKHHHPLFDARPSQLSAGGLFASRGRQDGTWPVAGWPTCRPPSPGSRS